MAEALSGLAVLFGIYIVYAVLWHIAEWSKRSKENDETANAVFGGIVFAFLFATIGTACLGPVGLGISATIIIGMLLYYQGELIGNIIAFPFRAIAYIVVGIAKLCGMAFERVETFVNYRRNLAEHKRENKIRLVQEEEGRRREAERPMRERRAAQERQELEIAQATEDYERGMRLVAGLSESERRKTERKLKKDLRVKIQHALGIVHVDDSDIEEDTEKEDRTQVIDRLRREFNAGMHEVMRLHDTGVISEEERDFGIMRLQSNLQQKIGDILGIDVS